jgi:hypothetical protein
VAQMWPTERWGINVMIPPLESDERCRLHPPAPFRSHNLEEVKREEAARDFLIVVVLVALFVGALFLLLTRRTKLSLSPTLRKERWKDWRPLA